MDSRKMEELLNKYWNCETSLEEEQQLRECFKGKDFPQQHKETAALFHYFNESKKKALTDTAFDSQVIAKVRPQGKLVKLAYNSMRIAAGVAVLVVAGWFVRNEIRNSSPQATVETYEEDPKLAFEETKKALMMISKSFASAEKQAKKINMFNEAQDQIQKEKKEAKSQL